MKIGILTFHAANNYGAFLQAKSLKDTISSYENCDCEIINYKPPYLDKEYSPNPLNEKTAKLKLLHLLKLRDILKRNKKFEKYRKQCFSLTKEVQTGTQLAEICNEFDKIVVGSDQVWNFKITESDCAFFFENTKDSVKKFSYAASTGGFDFPSEHKDKIAKLLGNFSDISVREESLCGYFEENFGIKGIKPVLDPVYLTAKDKWLQFAKKTPEEDYVLFFQMGVSPKAEPALSFAKELSRKHGLKLLYISDQERWYKFRDVRHVGVVDPAQFLGYIANAKYVITNSFHATSFSIIFNTPFFVETNIAHNDRILNLLKMFGLEDRGLNTGRIESGETEIDWNKVNIKLEAQRADSLSFIDRIIEK